MLPLCLVSPFLFFYQYVDLPRYQKFYLDDHALVGSLPGCKAVVDVIMVYLAKPVDPVLYKKIHAHQGDLVMAYEMYMTFYEKNAP